MIIIPAIDIIDGKCVRLTKGDYSTKKVYNEDPLEVALQFQDLGIQRLHLVDLDGAKAGRVINWKVLEKLAAKTQLAIDFGGGVKTLDDARVIFESGALLTTLGSIAVKDTVTTASMLLAYGAARFFFGADVHGNKLAIHGWQEQTEVTIDAFLEQYLALEVHQYFCTDISKDGMLAGPATMLYRQLLQDHPGIQLTASGGVRHVQDIAELEAAGLHGVIIGKAIYEGHITYNELKGLIA